MKGFYYRLFGLVMIFFLLSMPVWAAGYKIITAAALRTRLIDKDFFLLDVHIPEQSHISGTDAFIDFRKIRQNAPKLPVDKETDIVIYCLGGGMSRVAAEEILEMGYSHVYVLSGGTQAFNMQKR